MCERCKELEEALGFSERTVKVLRETNESKQELIELLKGCLNETSSSKQKGHAPHLRIVR